jgi:hypothetical protein
LIYGGLIEYLVRSMVESALLACLRHSLVCATRLLNTLLDKSSDTMSLDSEETYERDTRALEG